MSSISMYARGKNAHGWLEGMNPLASRLRALPCCCRGCAGVGRSPWSAMRWGWAGGAYATITSGSGRPGQFHTAAVATVGPTPPLEGGRDRDLGRGRC
jgi:hypothetical protein